MNHHDSPEPRWSTWAPEVAIVAVLLAVAAVLVLKAFAMADDPSTPTSTTTSTTGAVDVGTPLHVDASTSSTLMLAAAEHAAPAAASRGTARGELAPAPPVAKPETPQVTALATNRETGVGYGGRVHLGRFRVTCYSPAAGFPRGQHTASGQPVGDGSIAGDPRVLGGRPTGRVRLELDGIGVGRYEDTGGAVTGHHLDLWRPSCAGWANPTVDVWRLQ